MRNWVIGVDLGATKTALGLISPDNRIVDQRRIPTAVAEHPQVTVEGITQCVEELRQSLPEGTRIDALGICTPGPLDHITGTLLDPPNLPTFHNVPLRQILEDHLRLPVSLDHDANAAALGEFYYGAGRDVPSMVYVVVGTGVGSAIIMDGHIMRGMCNSAGEVGHMTLDRDGELCSCGSKGCVETYMSGPWISRHYQRASATAGTNPIELQQVTGADVARLATQGDPLAIQILASAGEALGIAVASLAMILDIELYIIGGSVAKSGDFFLEPARKIVPRHSYSSVGSRVQISRGMLADDAPILGSGWLARQMDQQSERIPVPVTTNLRTAEDPTLRTSDDLTGIVFDIQRYSLHDGPGLRTIVFLKGCPLRCGWCANPEAKKLQPELAVFEDRCITCGQFNTTCFALRESQNGFRSPELMLSSFQERMDLCPVQAVHQFGQVRTVSSVMAEVCRDKPFFGGGGGMTLTGGEPTMQPDFAEALLKAAKAEDISTAIETCGHTSWSTFEQLLPYLDSILFDLKHVDSELHLEHTGVANDLILSNLRKLVASDTRLTLRIPLIPGFNTSQDSLQLIGRFVQDELGDSVEAVDLLPYHTLGKNKYQALGTPYPWEAHALLSDDDIERCASIFRKLGFQVNIGG